MTDKLFMQNLQKIRSIALEVRNICEEIKTKRNPFAIGTDMMGACAIASTYLSYYLHQENINNKIICAEEPGDDGSMHCWVETETHLIDLTHTQFNKHSPKVLIVEKGSKEYKNLRKVWTNFQEVDNMDFFRDWHDEQKPRRWIKFFNKRKNMNLSVAA